MGNYTWLCCLDGGDNPKCLLNNDAMTIITVTLGETVPNNRFVHINGEGLAVLATSTLAAVGYVSTGAANSEIVQVFLSGIIPAPFEGLSGQIVYLGAGGVASGTPSAQRLGVLTDDGRMVLNVGPKVEAASGGGVALAATYFKI